VHNTDGQHICISIILSYLFLAEPDIPASQKKLLIKNMSSPPKPDDENVAQSITPEEDRNTEVDRDQSTPRESGKDDTQTAGIMDDAHDIEVKEQDRWLPIANG
jgi:hypothetical protein